MPSVVPHRASGNESEGGGGGGGGGGPEILKGRGTETISLISTNNYLCRVHLLQKGPSG